jgi:FkbM family methyltransferase
MNSHDFKNHILQRFFEDIHTTLTDNYAPERYSFDGVDRSEFFDAAKHANYLDWFIANHEDIFQAYERFADQRSKDLYIDLIRYRLAGHLHVKINSAPAHFFAEQAHRFKGRFTGEVSALAATGMFGSLVHYDDEWENIRYTVDTIPNGLLYYLVYRQYFFNRDGVIIQPEAGDHVIDGGAFMGETAIVFSRAVGPLGRVYAFDPLQNHLDVCNYNRAQSNSPNVVSFGYGLSDETIQAPPLILDQYSPGWRVTGTVPLCRIDDLVGSGQIDHIDAWCVRINTQVQAQIGDLDLPCSEPLLRDIPIHT